MAWFRRTESTRAYPAAGTSVTGSTSRFRRSKTTSARRADRDGQAWEQQDRDNERGRRGRYSR